MIIDENVEIIDPTKIKLISQTGGRVEESSLIQGLMLPKKRISSQMVKEIADGKILLIDGGLEQRGVKGDLKLNVTDTGVLESFRQQERIMLKSQVDKLVNNGVNVLACKEGIDDDIRDYLVKNGIQAFRRVSRSDLNMLARACSATLVNSINSSRSEDAGDFKSSRNISLDGKDFWVVEAIGKAATIIAKGSTVDIIGEVERCFDDSLGVSVQLLENGQIVCGGGASYVALARRLRRYAETMPGREQLAVEAYADAIEVIIRVLAENAGIDPISSLIDVVAEQTNLNSDSIGINLTTGKPDDMLEIGVLEPKGIIKQALIGATEVSISILRIDDVLWAKQDIEAPVPPQSDM